MPAERMNRTHGVLLHIRNEYFMVTIIQADLLNPEHTDALVDLLDCYALDPMGRGAGLSEHVRENIANALRERKGCHVILAYKDDNPAGLLIGFEGFSTFACKPLLNVHDIVVLPECRGEGISTMLLKKAEQIAMERGCCKMTLEVLEGNKTALISYSRFGFVNYQLDPKYGKAVFLEKKL